MALFDDMTETIELNETDEILLHQGTTDKRIAFQYAANLAYADRYGYSFLGDHAVGTSYTSLESFAVYGGRAYWPKSDTTLPYSATTVNPANDSNLENTYYTDAAESTQLEENTTAIATNLASIETLNSEVNTNAEDIVSNTADIVTNAADIVNNTTDITTNATNISTNLSKINSNTANISALQENETIVQGGTFTVEGNDTKTITFVTTFSSCTSVVISARQDSDGAHITSKSSSSFSVENTSSSDGSYYWIAMGT